MIAGFAAQDAERRVIGIDGSARPAETREQVARIARRTAELIELGRELRDDEIVLDDRYHAGTYGIPDEQTLEAIRTAGRLEGMITDPVYEGKSMAGMIDLVSRGEIEKGSNVLYAHLGGQPALSAYARAVPLRASAERGRVCVIPPDTSIGKVRLRVADIDALTEFYERVVGLRSVERDGDLAGSARRAVSRSWSWCRPRTRRAARASARASSTSRSWCPTGPSSHARSGGWPSRAGA